MEVTGVSQVRAVELRQRWTNAREARGLRPAKLAKLAARAGLARLFEVGEGFLVALQAEEHAGLLEVPRTGSTKEGFATLDVGSWCKNSELAGKKGGVHVLGGLGSDGT